MDTYTLEKNQVFNKKFYKTIATIALPIAFQNLLMTLLNMIDTFMISSVGIAAIGGVGVANKLFFMLDVLLFGINSGASILAAQYWGVKDKKNIRRVLGITLIIGLSCGVIFTILAIFFPEPIIRIFTPDEPEVILEGSKYLRIIGLSYCFTVVSFTYGFIARATHHLTLPTVVSVVSIFINTGLNYCLIFGNFGMPEMGVEGAAIATVVARVFECIVLVTLMYAKKYPSAGKIREIFDLSRGFVNKYFKIVLPVIINEFFWALGVTMYSLVYGRMGTVVIASMTITQTIEGLAFVVLIGLSNAAAVMLGNALGSGEKEKTLMYSKKFIKMILGVGILSAVFLFAITNTVVRFYHLDAEVGMNIRHTIWVLALFLPFKGLNLLLIVGALRSGGDTTAAMLLDMVAVWCIGIPLSVIGGLVLKLDIAYVYALVLCEEVVKLFFALWRVRSKKWLKNIVS